jgi:hypothetical protein
VKQNGHKLHEFAGRHNADLEASRNRLERGGSYRDLSTVIVIPTRGLIPAKVVQSWWSLFTPMNQKCFRYFVENMEVGEAYNHAVETILGNPELAKYKYMLTLEEDNLPPPDGLLKLYESIDKYGAVGGLYWTKGEAGMPMVYGNPKEFPKNFIPQVPLIDTVQECNGLGMGFTLFKISMFKKTEKPWFKTVQEYLPGQGSRAYTQDLYAFEQFAKQGYRFACDTRVKVGHYDHQANIVW